MNITKDTHSIEIKADFCGSEVDALLCQTGERHGKTGLPFFRVDYRNPVTGFFEFGPQYSFETIKKIYENNKIPKIA